MAEEDPAENDSQPMEKVMHHETIQYVGERNAIVFSAAMGEPLPPLELPDDFFDLNKDDIKILYNDLKQNRDQFENIPMRTKAVREMEESAAALDHLRKYTQTVIRVQFPDRLVLQAVFNHSDTVETVVGFIKNHLDTSDIQFCLYTAPPKVILKPEVTLLDSKLTPRALVYFGVNPSVDRTSFLKPSLMSSLTVPRLASEAAFQYRRQVEDNITDEEQKVPAANLNNCSQKSNKPSTSKKSMSSSTKVPKWFKQ